MKPIVRINDERIEIEECVRIWKLTGRFEGLMEELVRDKLAVHAAKKRGIRLGVEEIQERADQYRRAQGLHRAADMNNYLDALDVSLDEFEVFITEGLYQEKVMAEVCSDRSVEEYFKLNSPRFDCIEVSHIVLDTEGKAREMIAYLEDDPESFADMAREHSIADTRDQGGLIGKVLRGALKTEVEARVFNAEVGDLLGPFPSPDGSFYEIFTVKAKHPAALDEETATEIRRLLREEWLGQQAREHVIEAL